jgi:hypothetical protein
MITPAVFLFFLLQSGKGSIEGAVINSVTNKPIAGAQVQATKMPAAMPTTGAVPTAIGRVTDVTTPTGMIIRQAGGAAPVQISPATTDANGHFAFPDLEPGTYLLRAFAEGYARQEFNPRPGATDGMTAQVTLAAGTVLKDTVFRLVPGGTVSGRVTGSNGEPLVNLEVTLLRSGYDPDGQKRLFQQAAATPTNDRGEYRLFWVTPGRYYLSVASSTRPMPGVPFFPGMSANKYPRTFYPGTTDASNALLVEIQAAAELSGMDFRLTEQPTYRVRGRIVDSTSGQAPRGVSMGIIPRDVNNGLSMSGEPYNHDDGTFEFRDVPSGEYMIRSQLPFNGRFEPGQPPSIPPIAMTFVDVRGGDVEGVVLTFQPPVSLSGRITIDGKAPPAGLRANVSLRPVAFGLNFGPPPRAPQFDPDGTFRIDGIPPGEYRVEACCIAGQQANTYVKEIRLGSVDLLTYPLVVSGSIPESLEVVFGEGPGEISGTVQGDSQKAPANAFVVLVPDRRERHNVYKFTVTDAAGHFTFRTVPPGSYKVFAWEDIERNSWFDADVLRRYEQYGTPARVSDSGNVTLNVKLSTK